MIYEPIDKNIRIRFITMPYQRYTHFTGSKIIPCNVYKSNPKCPGCDAGFRAKRRWLAGVLVRGTPDQVKIFEFGSKLYSEIQQLVRDPDYGNPENFDITIRLDQSQPYGFIVLPARVNTPLTPDELEIKKQIDLRPLADSQIEYQVSEKSQFGFLQIDQSSKSEPGKTCAGCKEFYPYADQNNQPDGTFKCYGCRV